MLKAFSNKINKQGFTLLEMIVSLGVFSIIAVIAVGSLVRITSLNRQAQSLQSAMNNINYILESISREMRFGSTFSCTSSTIFSGRTLSASVCDSSSVGVLFKSSKTAVASGSVCPLIYAYWFQQSGSRWNIKKSQQKICDEAISLSTASVLIDTVNINISVTDVNFKVFTGPLGYSRVLIRLIGQSGIKTNEKSEFDIWTQVSQRMRD